MTSKKDVWRTRWNTRYVPGQIQVSTRRTIGSGLLIEEIVLERKPLNLARYMRQPDQR